MHLKGSVVLELQQNIYVKTFSYLFPQNSCILNHCLSAEVSIPWESNKRQRWFLLFQKLICQNKGIEIEIETWVVRTQTGPVLCRYSCERKLSNALGSLVRRIQSAKVRSRLEKIKLPCFLNGFHLRDVFYDILFDWEKNHKSENWNFVEVHGQQIKDLVSFEPNSANCLCFVKLFQEQLILVWI